VAAFDHPWVDDSVGPLEDAALLRPESGPALVFSVDFITPIVDHPETFGAIAAANSLSDIYAMGGEPQVALAICGFPEGEVDTEVLSRIFRGGRDKAAEAGCAIVGGHTVMDPELKYGLCVLGSVESEHTLSQTGARVGDRLVLTKPIGVGIAAQAIKQGRLGADQLDEVVTAMVTLNKGAKDAALAAGAHAATDVTGFGLLGHLRHLVLGAGAGARLAAGAVPSFPFVRRLAEEGAVPGGTRRNLAYVTPTTSFEARIDETDRHLLSDAQTSGGLLIAVPPDREARLLDELEQRETLTRAVIGQVVEAEPGHVEVMAGEAV
jgi:selenide,water dikinase